MVIQVEGNSLQVNTRTVMKPRRSIIWRRTLQPRPPPHPITMMAVNSCKRTYTHLRSSVLEAFEAGNAIIYIFHHDCNRGWGELKKGRQDLLAEYCPSPVCI